MAPVTIRRATEATDSLLRDVQRLIPQLNAKAAPPSREHLDALISSPAAELMLALDSSSDEPLVGMLTLARYPIPSGVRVWIEDVVVDESARGLGIGEALVRAALERARELGASTVELTSRPEREAANRLYRRMGFELRTTNAYRYHFRNR
ncbi:MAG: GNAT family N-acetyltransferase [Gemmatimonadetes bacterium]|nr:GNAT family N-acetyltransferase [Gemmatimonadota bacterium]